MATNLGFLPEIIKKMEEEGLTVQESMGLLDEARAKIEELVGSDKLEAEWCERLKSKFESVVTKNPDIKIITDMVQSLKMGDKVGPHMELLKYCPITSVDVERSFSRYKKVLTDDRHRLLKENISKIKEFQA